jgi:hypothetical protein
MYYLECVTFKERLKSHHFVNSDPRRILLILRYQSRLAFFEN